MSNHPASLEVSTTDSAFWGLVDACEASWAWNLGLPWNSRFQLILSNHTKKQMRESPCSNAFSRCRLSCLVSGIRGRGVAWLQAQENVEACLNLSYCSMGGFLNQL